MSATPQVYQLLIKASAEQIWAAITRPEFTSRYFYGARVRIDGDRLVSLGPDGSVWMDQPVEKYDPPRLLVHSWVSSYDPELAAEPASRVSWEIEPRDNGVCLLTVTHDRLEESPKTARSVSGLGWLTVLSALKTLLETGRPLSGEVSA